MLPPAVWLAADRAREERARPVTTSTGLERFITATRRQNFLIPPRRHRVPPARTRL